MISPNAALHEQAKIVCGLAPITPSTSTPDMVSMKNYSRASCIILVDNATVVTGSAITLNQATAVANTSGKALAFDKMYANADISATDTLVETAVTSNTFTTLTTNNANAMYVIDVREDMLDVAGGFDCFNVLTGNAVNTAVSVTYILFPAKYGKPAPPSAILD
jgi:hypothetical protein